MFRNPFKKPSAIFFCHVPKCEGTSVVHAFNDALRLSQEQWFHLSPEDTRLIAENLYLEPMTVREIILRYELNNPAVRFATGQVVCPPDVVDSHKERWQFVTLLREPLERLISAYLCRNKKLQETDKTTLSADEFLASLVDENYKGIYLEYFSSYRQDRSKDLKICTEEAINNLQQFALVGTLNSIDQWLARIEKKFSLKLRLGHANKGQFPEQYLEIINTPATKNKFLYFCKYDQIIYQAIQDCNNPSVG